MARSRAERVLPLAKVVLFAACLAPCGLLVWDAVSGSLGPNPVEALLHGTGDWALRLLLVTLAMTPLRRLTGQVWPIRLRRMLGLFAFFYVALHLTVYLWLDRELAWSTIVDDVIKRPYISVGFVAFLMLIPLALTSTRGWMRRLGRRWTQLHRAVYVIAVLGVVHYLWLVKADLREPLIYASVLTILLAFRVPWDRLGAMLRGVRVGRSGP
ncbi:Sulfoxide reductase heme-binding subunit yedZ [Thiorhodococcus drewsii AZ1]|uniref:Protein-methionine-sulfoxide reductase heme-binding subunit MsrQ n=1 Tax=Thiorhodococcus drewsii AZ1 TaxID=765913 RepID=G2E2F3_9GAMM|nr:protein-methionine-sulfoxide reductase heme-binding subunit MsrQ [Thiorhodococcus drewsii]EGV30869.1 Sulfoxide reductase heme-binding subunit yedZ [Thiorhodococcus drewsii AZ1]